MGVEIKQLELIFFPCNKRALQIFALCMTNYVKLLFHVINYGTF